MRSAVLVLALAACTTDHMPGETQLESNLLAFATYRDAVVWATIKGDDLVVERRQPNHDGEVWRRARDPDVNTFELIAGSDGVVVSERNSSYCVRLTWIRTDGRAEELPLPDCTTDATLYDQFGGGLIISGFQRVDLATHTVALWPAALDGAMREHVRGAAQDFALVSRTEGYDVVSISRTDPPVVTTLAASVAGQHLFASPDAIYWFAAGTQEIPTRVFRARIDRPSTPDVWFENARYFSYEDLHAGRLAWADGTAWLVGDGEDALYRLSSDNTLTTFPLAYRPGSLTEYRGQLLIPTIDDPASGWRLLQQGLP